ncbi:MAG TPA: dockerin type I repeat-containing protein [Terriglobales bacterium]|nr:dockerin type I repeat-containing protein [Terriglobales bacterium]
MKRSTFIVLFVILAFIVFSVVLSAKERESQNPQRPTHIQKAEQNLEPQFPKVAPAPSNVWEPVRRGKLEDLQRVVQLRKGKTPAEINQMQKQPVHVPEANLTEEAQPNYCVVQNLDLASCCYYQPAGNPYLSCWGVVRFMTFLDIDNNTSTPACNFPYYPFDVDTVRFQIYAGDACSLYVKARVYTGYQTDPNCWWVTAPVYYSDSFWVHHEGAFAYINIPIADANACVYGPFFAMVYIMNTDQFYQGSDTTCSSAPFQFGLSWVFDQSGRTCQSYWGSPTYLDGYLYDMVADLGTVSGPIRIRAIGHTATDNACSPPADEWYYKDSLDAAPGGLPDFDQGQFPAAYCGPTAGADLLWWQAANAGLTMPPDVPTVVNDVAAASGTVAGIGTVCDSLGAGILQVIKTHGGWWFAETTVYAPDFVYIQKYTRECHTMTLLLGFWQNQGGIWHRFGGHFVAVSGVDIFAPTYQVALSDPATDNAETGGLGVVYPHPAAWPHVGNFTAHNDPANVSKDWYTVAWPSASPGGYLYLPEYGTSWTDSMWSAFNGQNAGPFANTTTYDSALDVNVEVEQVIDLYAGIRGMQGEVQSSKASETNNNSGGLDAFTVTFGSNVVSGLYKGSIIAGTSQTDLNNDYGNFSPARTFNPSGPPALDSFTVTGTSGDYKIYQLTNRFEHKFIPGLDITEYAFGFWVPAGDVGDCEYVVEDAFVFDNTTDSVVSALQTAIFLDYDIGVNNACKVDFDQVHRSLWMWDQSGPDTVFGVTKIPAVVGDEAVTGWGISNTARIYDGQYLDSLKYWMENLGWGSDLPTSFEDKSILLADNSFDLAAGEMRMEKWLKWGYRTPVGTNGDAAWRHFLYHVLHQQGYYRGDVNGDMKLDVMDIVYLVAYIYKSGSSPKEFTDQGDVNDDGNVNVVDIMYLVNYIFKRGPAPIDKNRFLANSPFVDTPHKALAVRNPGLFGDSNWWNLGR